MRTDASACVVFVLIFIGPWHYVRYDAKGFIALARLIGCDLRLHGHGNIAVSQYYNFHVTAGPWIMACCAHYLLHTVLLES